MIKHSFIEWASRTGCHVMMEIKTPYHYVFLSLQKPYRTMYGTTCDEITEVSSLCTYPTTEWEEGQYITPDVSGLKKYSVIDWVRWLRAPVTVEIETDRNNVEHVEYYVYSGNTQTCITPFIKDGRL